MMTEFNLRHFTELYDTINPLKIHKGIINRPLYVQWNYEVNEYEFRRTDNNVIFYIYVSQELIIVLYSDKTSVSPHPNNLVMYNLRQEVIGIIPPPKLVTTKFDEPITAIDNLVDIDGEQYLQVCINYGDVKAVLETHYFNIQKREYHPDKVEILRFGNYR